MLVLYILGRNDLDSLGKGKFGAQCAHVQSVFDDRFFHYALRAKKLTAAERREFDQYLEWKRQEGRFGTVVTKAVDYKQMTSAVMLAKHCGLLAEITPDPSYPLLDGDVIHEIPLETGAYVFGDSDDPLVKAILRPLPLYPVQHRGKTD